MIDRPGLVRTERDGHVLVITMVRESKRNAIDRAMADALDEAFNLMEDDGDIRAGVLAATGRAFSAGSDLNANGDYVTERGGEYGLVRRRRTKPLVAAVDGPALGGGFELVLACDLVVASDRAVFGLPEVCIGVVPICGALFRAPRQVPVNIARQLMLTGDPISAAEAHRVGLVNVLTAPGGAAAGAVATAQRISANAPVAVRACLAAVDDVIAGDADDAGWAATAGAARAIEGSADAREGVRAFLQKRPPVWTGR